MRTIKRYKIDELCNENRAILVAGDNEEIMIEVFPKGLGIYISYGGNLKPIDDLGHYIINNDPNPLTERIKQLEEENAKLKKPLPDSYYHNLNRPYCADKSLGDNAENRYNDLTTP